MSVSEDGFINSKYEILQLFSQLDDADLHSIEQWICTQAYKKDLAEMKALQQTEKKLLQIGNTIKELIPFEAEMISENIVPPKIGSSSDCTKVNTCHIDEFLYDDSAIDKLEEEGRVRRHYCLDCNSRKVEPLILTSHSMSRPVLQYVFKVLLPEDLEGKQLLDVGSRIGAVLYGAYYYSNASMIIGVEVNKECCTITETIIEKHSIDNNRVKVVHSDIMEKNDIVANSDIVLINILDFFMDADDQKKIWRFFKTYIKKGSYLICNRGMPETLDMLDLSEEFIDWVSICKPQQQYNERFVKMEDYDDTYLYTVN